jgi:hypothetical protein
VAAENSKGEVNAKVFTVGAVVLRACSRPRRGLIKISQQSMIALRQSLK